MFVDIAGDHSLPSPAVSDINQKPTGGEQGPERTKVVIPNSADMTTTPSTTSESSQGKLIPYPEKKGVNW